LIDLIAILKQFDLNVFAIFLLIMLFLVIRFNRDGFRFSTHLIKIILWLTVAALIIEPMSWIFDKSGEFINLFLNYLSNYLLVLVAPILIGMWASYFDYIIFNDRKRLKKYHYYQYGTYLVAALCVVNAFYPLFFSIDEFFTYQPESLVWITMLIVYGFYIHIVVLTIMNRKRVRNNVIYGVIVFFIVPIGGSMIQLFEATLFYTWTMLALAIVVVYIFLETTTGTRDYLTNLFSRLSLEDYMNDLLQASRHFDVVMIDLNSFKHINDRFGHQIGDQVLIRFSTLLQSAFHDEKMVARLGGDEFFVIVETLNQSGIKQRIADLRAEIKTDAFCQQYECFGFSWGLACNEINMTMDDLLTEADRRMYLDKPGNKTDPLSQ
jgi:diguanylate cyclase (GGDEF)-like protein